MCPRRLANRRLSCSGVWGEGVAPSVATNRDDRTRRGAGTQLLARANLTLVSIVTLVDSNISDWNRTHIFSELWSPHAHLHAAWFVLAISLLSVLSRWLIWSPAEQPARSRIAANPGLPLGFIFSDDARPGHGARRSVHRWPVPGPLYGDPDAHSARLSLH